MVSSQGINARFWKRWAVARPAFYLSGSRDAKKVALFGYLMTASICTGSSGRPCGSAFLVSQHPEFIS
jgi:hypothetical protein